MLLCAMPTRFARACLAKGPVCRDGCRNICAKRVIRIASTECASVRALCTCNPYELFDRVATSEAAQNAAQYPTETRRDTPRHDGREFSSDHRTPRMDDALRDDATMRNETRKWRRGESNPRPDSQKPDRSGENGGCHEAGGAESGAVGADPVRPGPTDSDLARLIDAWHSLSKLTRSEILALVDSARDGPRK